MKNLRRIGFLWMLCLLVLNTVAIVKAEQTETNNSYGDNFKPGQLIVKMEPNSQSFRLSDINDHLPPEIEVDQVRILSKEKKAIESTEDALGETLLVSLVADDKQSVKDAVKLLEQHPNVKFAEPDYIVYMDHPVATTKPQSLADSSLHWNLERIGMREAWNVTKGSSAIRVGVIDTGINHMYPDLIHNVDTSSGYDFVLNRADATDVHGHGTQIAGVIGAIGENNYNVMGVAPEVTMVPLRVLDAHNRGFSSDFVRAINHANDLGLDIINFSISSRSHSQVLENAIRSFDGLFVTMAGNDASDIDAQPAFPASLNIPNMITVGNSNQTDQRNPESNKGQTSVDLFAPGTKIKSTNRGNHFNTNCGTSMATAHVTGAAVLALAADPTLSPVELKAVILETVEPVPALANLSLTGGILNVEKLIATFNSENPIVKRELDVQRISWVTRPDDNKQLSPKSTIDVSRDYLDRHGRSVINLLVTGKNNRPLDLTEYKLLFSQENVLGNTTTTPEWQERGHIHFPILDTGETTVSLQHRETQNIEKLLTFAITPEVPEKTEPETPEAPEFDRNTTYFEGDIVLYRGNLYRAKWWTRGGSPETSLNWDIIPTVHSDGSVNFRLAAAYDSGTVVRHEGRLYRARWWSQMVVPTTSNAWEFIGYVQD